MKAEQIYKMIRREKIIAIARGVEKDRIIDIAEALLAGGIKMLEVTCNTEGVFEMIKLLCREDGRQDGHRRGDGNNDRVMRKGASKQVRNLSLRRMLIPM